MLLAKKPRGFCATGWPSWRGLRAGLPRDLGLQRLPLRRFARPGSPPPRHLPRRCRLLSLPSAPGAGSAPERRVPKRPRRGLPGDRGANL